MHYYKTSFVVLFLLILNSTMGQSIKGDWSGKLNAMGQELPLIFHISEEADGLSATMDSPAQGANGIPVEKVEFSENTLSMSMMGGQATYEGTLDGDTITGKFKQAGMEFDLNLTKGELEKPGDTSLPSSEEELKALANKEEGNYKYYVKDYFAKPASSSFQLSPDGTYMSYREKDENLKNHVYVKNIKTNDVQRVITEGEELIRGYGWAN